MVHHCAYPGIYSTNDATSLNGRGNRVLLRCPWTWAFSYPCLSWSFCSLQPQEYRFASTHRSKQTARCIPYPYWSAHVRELLEGLSTWDLWMPLFSKYCQRILPLHSSATWVKERRIFFGSFWTYSFSAQRRETGSNPRFCQELASVVLGNLQRIFARRLAVISVSCRLHWIREEPCLRFHYESLARSHWRGEQCHF